MRARVFIALIMAAGSLHALYAQQAGDLRFDVVSIKRNLSAELGGRNAIEPGRYVGRNVTVRRLIALAYMPLPGAQIVGGPAWLNSERFDVEAKFPGDPSREQLQAMMRTLLADQFKLRTHRESRRTGVFALMTAGNPGPALRPSEIDCSDASRALAQARAAAAGGPACAFQYTDGLVRGRGVTLDQVAAELVAGRVVINRTGLPGRYDVELRWTPDAVQAPSDDAPPALATALREQLGLRLQPETTPLDFLVIDSIERPELD